MHWPETSNLICFTKSKWHQFQLIKGAPKKGNSRKCGQNLIGSEDGQDTLACHSFHVFSRKCAETSVSKSIYVSDRGASVQVLVILRTCHYNLLLWPAALICCASKVNKSLAKLLKDGSHLISDVLAIYYRNWNNFIHIYIYMWFTSTLFKFTSLTDYTDFLLPWPAYSASKLMIIPHDHTAHTWLYVWMSVAVMEKVRSSEWHLSWWLLATACLHTESATAACRISTANPILRHLFQSTGCVSCGIINEGPQQQFSTVKTDRPGRLVIRNVSFVTHRRAPSQVPTLPSGA